MPSRLPIRFCDGQAKNAAWRRGWRRMTLLLPATTFTGCLLPLRRLAPCAPPSRHYRQHAAPKWRREAEENAPHACLLTVEDARWRGRQTSCAGDGRAAGCAPPRFPPQASQAGGRPNSRAATATAAGHAEATGARGKPSSSVAAACILPAPAHGMTDAPHAAPNWAVVDMQAMACSIPYARACRANMAWQRAGTAFPLLQAVEEPDVESWEALLSRAQNALYTCNRRGWAGRKARPSSILRRGAYHTTWQRRGGAYLPRPPPTMAAHARSTCGQHTLPPSFMLPNDGGMPCTAARG